MSFVTSPPSYSSRKTPVADPRGGLGYESLAAAPQSRHARLGPSRSPRRRRRDRRPIQVDFAQPGWPCRHNPCDSRGASLASALQRLAVDVGVGKRRNAVPAAQQGELPTLSGPVMFLIFVCSALAAAESLHSAPLPPRGGGKGERKAHGGERASPEGERRDAQGGDGGPQAHRRVQWPARLKDTPVRRSEARRLSVSCLLNPFFFRPEPELTLHCTMPRR